MAPSEVVPDLKSSKDQIGGPNRQPCNYNVLIMENLWRKVTLSADLREIMGAREGRTVTTMTGAEKRRPAITEQLDIMG